MARAPPPTRAPRAGKPGKPLSPIDGMPVAIKDLLETKDMPTEMNCAAFRGNFPKRDNAAVWALRQAGAVVFGKAVTAELGGTQPGPTTNPWDPARTPGGSSSGSAAAIRGAHGSRGARHPSRRIRDPPRRLLRHACAEADTGRHQPRRAPDDEPEHHRRPRGLDRRPVAGRDRDCEPLRRRSRAARD
jgi:hypothetical protein